MSKFLSIYLLYSTYVLSVPRYLPWMDAIAFPSASIRMSILPSLLSLPPSLPCRTNACFLPCHAHHAHHAHTHARTHACIQAEQRGITRCVAWHADGRPLEHFEAPGVGGGGRIRGQRTGGPTRILWTRCCRHIPAATSMRDLQDHKASSQQPAQPAHHTRQRGEKERQRQSQRQGLKQHEHAWDDIIHSFIRKYRRETPAVRVLSVSAPLPCPALACPALASQRPPTQPASLPSKHIPSGT